MHFFRGRSSSVSTGPIAPAERPEEKPLDDASVAAQAKGKKAILSSAALVEVPKAILDGSSLQDINLDYNNLTSVPAALFGLPALKKLSLQHNYIAVVGEDAVAASGKKLSTVDLTGNPLAFPPPLVAAKGWSTVKKWVPANPSFCMYRIYYGEKDGVVQYTDFNLSTVRDVMVKTKDEDRDAIFVKVEGKEEVERLETIERHKMDAKQGSAQTGPGWCSAPNATGVHLKVLEHLYISVFDGHCGKWVAQALTTNLYKKMAEADLFQNERPIEYETVIRQVWMDLDRVICKKLIEEKWNDGSTAVAVTFKQTGEMICAHVGDSRASARVGRADVELTHDHDPGVNKAEKQRVEERGGTVEFVKGCWRINKNLSVSRAFGDVNLKEGILEEGKVTLVDADPEVSVRSPFTDMDWIVVASDGLWHLMDNKDVIKMAGSHLTAEEASIKLFSEIDGNTRSQLKGHDNTTITCGKMYHGAVPTQFRVHGEI